MKSKIIPALLHSIIGWVGIGIGTKGKRRFVVALAKVWEIEN
jgi:hypothetical protein